MFFFLFIFINCKNEIYVGNYNDYNSDSNCKNFKEVDDEITKKIKKVGKLKKKPKLDNYSEISSDKEPSYDYTTKNDNVYEKKDKNIYNDKEISSDYLSSEISGDESSIFDDHHKYYVLVKVKPKKRIKSKNYSSRKHKKKHRN